MEIDWLHRKGPTLSICVMGSVPFLGGIVVSLGALGANLRPGAVASMAVISLTAIIALVFLLARVRLAPLLSLVVALLAWVGARLVATTVGAMMVEEWGGIRPGTGGDLAAPAAVMAAAAGIAIWRRAAFDQPLKARELLPRAREGGRALLRPGSGAPMRALCALGLLLVGFIALGSLLPDATDLPDSPWRGLAVSFSAGTGVIVGLGLMLSSFRLPDEASLVRQEPQVVPVRSTQPKGSQSVGGGPSAGPPAPADSAAPPSVLQGPAIGELPPSMRNRQRKP